MFKAVALQALAGLMAATATISTAGLASAHFTPSEVLKARGHVMLCGSAAPCTLCDVAIYDNRYPAGAAWHCPVTGSIAAGMACRCKSPTGWQSGKVTVHVSGGP